MKTRAEYTEEDQRLAEQFNEQHGLGLGDEFVCGLAQLIANVRADERTALLGGSATLQQRVHNLELESSLFLSSVAALEERAGVLEARVEMLLAENSRHHGRD